MRKVGFFDICVDDMDRAQAFYETVLDTKLSPMGDPNDPTVEMRSFGDDFASHGAGGALVKLEFAKPGPGGSMVYFSCEDCAVEEARATAAGGSIVRPKYSIGEHGFVSIVADTEGTSWVGASSPHHCGQCRTIRTADLPGPERERRGVPTCPAARNRRLHHRWCFGIAPWNHSWCRLSSGLPRPGR